MQLVGRYRIEQRIGEGAMADVYRAHDPSIDRVLAIKVLKKEFRENQEIARRFLREARAAGALSHPNIVTVYDVGEVDGYPYIAMELIDGVPLDDHIRDSGKLPLNQIIRTGVQLARALDYAHGLGVVHRDIKPSNIMLCDGGRTAKLLDFGIARMGEADRVRAELNALRTQVGQVIGTPRYMSPEQALGLEIDHRSDLFSLGVVLYEMITGKTAFSGTSIATIAIQITQQNPTAIRSTLPDCPRGLQFVVDKLLAKQPEKRFATGADVADALKREQEALTNEKHGRRSLSLQWRLSLVMSAATALALFASIGAALDRQYLTMEQMALTSGTSISNFVANNVALRAVENAGLPPSQQDWLPVQAFMTAAASDPNIKKITMIDATGVVRGSSDADELGEPYAQSNGEAVLSTEAAQKVTATPDGGFRFLRTIEYAGQPFGKIELVVGSEQLKAAATQSRNLLVSLGIALFFVVLCLSYGIAQLLARPIRRLKTALADAAAGNLDFRISHKRTDEFGELFDGFNNLAASLAERPGNAAEAKPADADLDATRIDIAPVAKPQRRGFGRRSA
jgi:eukaryotic-like serine/threonine-protein kinase